MNRPWFEWASEPLSGFRLGTVGFLAYPWGLMFYAGPVRPLSFGLPLEWPNKRDVKGGWRVAFGLFSLTWVIADGR